MTSDEAEIILCLLAPTTGDMAPFVRSTDGSRITSLTVAAVLRGLGPLAERYAWHYWGGEGHEKLLTSLVVAISRDAAKWGRLEPGMLRRLAVVALADATQSRVCLQCNGQGSRAHVICRECAGTGTKSVTDTERRKALDVDDWRTWKPRLERAVRLVLTAHADCVGAVKAEWHGGIRVERRGIASMVAGV